MTFETNGISIVNKENSITMTDDGIVVQDKNSNTLTKDGNGIIIEDKNGNTITMEQSGITVEDANGNQVVMGASGIQVGSSSASDFFVLGTQFAAKVATFIISLGTHTHVGNMGAPTSPPMAPITLEVPISSKHMVE
jgi:hypothetical protein